MTLQKRNKYNSYRFFKKIIGYGPPRTIKMTPKTLDCVTKSYEDTTEQILQHAKVQKGPKRPLKILEQLDTKFEQPLIWTNIILIFLIHVIGVYGLFLWAYYNVSKPGLFAFGLITSIMSGLGVTGGAHRLWSHRAYKAKLPLRVLLMLLFSMSGQNTLIQWVKDHRVHHKFSETTADPHNSNRGFFFAHCGWLMMNKDPLVMAKGKTLDFSDMYADPVVMFMEKYYTPMKILLCFVLPTWIPCYFWGETFSLSFYYCIGRYIYNLNSSWTVNSVAHMWGYRPYDTRLRPVENWLVSFAAMGEGWHNYHHAFPWDYKAAELGGGFWNGTAFFLECFAKIGWAYDMKAPSKELVEKVMLEHGDGSFTKGGIVPHRPGAKATH